LSESIKQGEVFSHSRLQYYRDCPLSYKYRYIHRLEIIDEIEEQHHASFGSAIHSGLEAYYKGGLWADIEKAFKEAYPNQLDTSDFAKTQDNGLKLLSEYIKRYQVEDSNWKTVATEVLEEFELLGHKFVAKLDLVVENKKYGGVYGVDHKTTSKNLSYRYFNQFEISSQIDLYTLYLEQKYGECGGMYINAMSFGFRKRKYKDEPAGFHWKFDRQLFNRTRGQLEAERVDLGNWIGKLKVAQETGTFERNTSKCGYCQYAPICRSGWTMKEDKELIMLQYRERQDAKSR